MENLVDDPSFIDAIVHEVKSQGLFDQFRKECLADVDTKPAYQNLRQRVESSVSKFLAQQKWTDNIRHKNQLREKLRKNIIESGFLETGVERIVDQVVNPKISTVFHPKVEEIVYNYLGVEKPMPVINGSGLEIQTDFMPEDLEAVSPDSDKKSSSASSDVLAVHEQSVNEELNESKENGDDFESPAFEPLETRSPSQIKQESNDSHASAISGLTSQESIESEHQDSVQEPIILGTEVTEIADRSDEPNKQDENHEDNMLHRIHDSPEIAQNDSQLSQVSSNSRLSIITNTEGAPPQHQSQMHPNPRLDIAEEAQMPKFNEYSNEGDAELPDSINKSAMNQQPQKFNFDLRKETYEFKGTVWNRQFSATDPDKNNENATSLGNGGEEKVDKQQKCSSPTTTSKYEENSTQSERSLRICEDSTLERRAFESCGQQDNCDSAKTPLNDEHSTQSAPDVEKMDSSQVEIVSLAVVQQHTEKERKSDTRDRDRSQSGRRSSSNRHRSSSSRDRRSHSSSKHSSSSRKSDHRDRKSENGNSNSNSGGSKKFHDKKNPDDDHYSSHEKPVKKRRSTDRDSNDDTDSGKRGRRSGEANNNVSGELGNNTTTSLNISQKRSGEMQDSQVKTNDSLESHFEGFDEEQLNCERRSAIKVEKPMKEQKKVSDKNCFVNRQARQKKSKKVCEKLSKENVRKVDIPNMDVFSFSFEKPAKLRKSGELIQEEQASVSPQEKTLSIDKPQEEAIDARDDPVDHLDECVIVLEPTEIQKVIEVNNVFNSLEGVSTVDEETLPPSRSNFPSTDPANIITLSKPVIVDQILTKGDNMDLELFIGDKPTSYTIQQEPTITKKVRKPKIASNFSEARKLMKVRKQMERNEREQLEQARVSARQQLMENGNISEEYKEAGMDYIHDSNIVNLKPESTNEEEEELLYFPEDNEVFPMNDKLLLFLKQKTDYSFPTNFTTENMKFKLFSLDSSEIAEHQTPSVTSSNEQEQVDELHKSHNTNAIMSEIWPEDSRQLSKSHEASIDGKMAQISEVNELPDLKQRNNKSKSKSPPVRNVEKMRNNELNKFDGSKIGRTLSDSETVENIQKKSTGKMKRLGLPKPKETLINNNSTTILMVDISDMNRVSIDKKSPSMNNNNNGAINAQRYSSDDLYKPRPLNGLRTRTRKRASEEV